MTWLSTKGADKNTKYCHIVPCINLQTVIAVYWTQTYETPNKFSFLCSDFTVQSHYVRVFLDHLYNSYGKSKDHRETWKCCDVLQKPRSNVKRCIIMNGGVAGVAGASLSFHTRVDQNISINCELRSSCVNHHTRQRKWKRRCHQSVMREYTTGLTTVSRYWPFKSTNEGLTVSGHRKKGWLRFR